MRNHTHIAVGMGPIHGYNPDHGEEVPVSHITPSSYHDIECRVFDPAVASSPYPTNWTMSSAETSPERVHELSQVNTTPHSNTTTARRRRHNPNRFILRAERECDDPEHAHYHNHVPPVSSETIATRTDRNANLSTAEQLALLNIPDYPPLDIPSALRNQNNFYERVSLSDPSSGQSQGRPIQEQPLEESQIDILDDFMLYIRSNFYHKHDIIGCIPSSRKWKLRYARFNIFGIYYKLDYLSSFVGSHIRYINLYDLDHIIIEDRENWEFSIVLRNHFHRGNNGVGEQEQDGSRQKRKSQHPPRYYCRAPSHEIFDAIIGRLQWFLSYIKRKPESELKGLALKAM
jgi:hypothetical protein